MSVSVRVVGERRSKTFDYEITFETGGTTYKVNHVISTSLDLSPIFKLAEPVVAYIDYNALADRLFSLAGVKPDGNLYEELVTELMNVVPSTFTF
jgi:hypothetical protein